MALLKHRSRQMLAGVACILACQTSTARGAVVVTGLAVPGLEVFDDAMVNFMTTNGIDIGVLAISKNGCIIYQRGFGYPENTPFRMASVEKPITAAAIRKLAATNINVANDLSDFVFNGGGNPNFNSSGILPHVPWQNFSGDSRLANIQVQHLVAHRGGWDRTAIAPCIGCTSCTGCSSCARDPQFAEVEIECGMLFQVSRPPGSDNTIRYMLSQPLDFSPGGVGCSNGPAGGGCYSNFGYMLLGRIVETVTGLPHWKYIQQNVITPDMWIPSTEIFLGRTFKVSQNAREPSYNCDGCTGTSVFNPGGPSVSQPYGGWDHESFRGHGNLVASAAPLLVFMDNYQVNNGGNSGTPLLGGSPNAGNHNGSITGTNAIMWQRGDSTGINGVVLFNERHPSEGQPNPVGGTFPIWANQMKNTIDGIINTLNTGGFTWPTSCVDGFWVDFNATVPSFYGAYDQPFDGMDDALSYVTAGSKLLLKPGSTNWTGTLATRMRLDAPLGLARIGQ